jgi:hypothetical protein
VAEAKQLRETPEDDTSQQITEITIFALQKMSAEQTKAFKYEKSLNRRKATSEELFLLALLMFVLSAVAVVATSRHNRNALQASN